jgi:hypothetical protein
VEGALELHPARIQRVMRSGADSRIGNPESLEIRKPGGSDVAKSWLRISFLGLSNKSDLCSTLKASAERPGKSRPVTSPWRPSHTKPLRT